MGGFAALPLGTLNVAATNFAKSYRNNGLIADLIAPRVPMDKQAFQYVVHDRSAMRLDGSDLRDPGTAPRDIRSSFTTANYFCKGHARAATIPFELEQFGEGFGFSQIQKATRDIMDKVLLGREVACAAALLGAGTTLALSGTSMFDNAASTPVENITLARSIARQSGVEANLLVLGSPVVDALVNNAEIINRVKYTFPGGVIDNISMDQLSAVFGIKCVRAAAVQVDKNDNISYVWGQTATLAYVQDVSDQADLSSAKTFVWSGAPGGGEGYSVIVEPAYPLSRKATIVSGEMYYDLHVTAPETLYTFTNCCAAPTYETLPAFATGY